MNHYTRNEATLACLLLLLSLLGATQEARPYNSEAPAVKLLLLQPSIDAPITLESLKGRAIVLEFWATWCAGCVAEIPHLNSIANEFKDHPVRFISVTDEGAEAVQWFLGKRPISGWVALDTDGTTFRNYGVVGRPEIALIDAKGNYRGRLLTSELTKDKVDQLIAGTLELKQPIEPPTPLIGTESGATIPLARILIRPAMPPEKTGMSPGAMTETEDNWEIWGSSLRTLLAYCTATSYERVLLPSGIERERYDVLISIPNATDETRRKVLQEMLETTFNARVHQEMRTTDAYVLRPVAGIKPELVRSEVGKTSSWVAEFAETALHKPVIDESGLKGRFRFLWSSKRTLGELNNQLKTTLGLELVPQRRPVRMVVFEPAAQN